jgi:hypothetical protein
MRNASLFYSSTLLKDYFQERRREEVKKESMYSCRKGCASDRNGMQTNFLLGSLQLSDQARLLLKRLPYDLVARHAINEHGTITPRERKQNALSMLIIGPIRSRYRTDPTNPKSKYVVIDTDATWSTTTISVSGE